MKIKISNKHIGNGEPTFIVAEAGINHNGKLKLAKKLVKKAQQCGADAIKFQTFKASDLFVRSSKLFKIFSRFELQNYEFKELSDYAKRLGLIFLSTPFSEEAVDMLEKLQTPAFKIASGDLTNIPLIKYASTKKKPILISTGMANLNEIKIAVNAIKSTGNKKIIILHSVSGYPTPAEDANLRSINFLKKKFPFPIGYSDNGMETDIPILAVAVGAQIVEKHFTLNNKLKGPDHKMSANPEQMKKMIIKIRQLENIFGKEVKACMPCELDNKINARRSIKSKITIKKGMKIQRDMLSLQRPSIGIEPKFLNQVVKRTAKRTIYANKAITWDSLK